MSTLKFGTSGLRGLVTDLEGRPSYIYATAFIHAVASKCCISKDLLIGQDLRASSSKIAATIVAAASAAGYKPIDCGTLPTPALALEAMRRGACAIMITGSHIPEDRNGLKFYRPDGEISKSDELNISAAVSEVSSSIAGHETSEYYPGQKEPNAAKRYLERYENFFPSMSLVGQKIAVYQQSSVARDLLVELLEKLGAIAVPLGRSSYFVPIDTEAHRPVDIQYIQEIMSTGEFFALVTTDGDADRPLLADATGEILRGDALGIITAKYLRADAVVVPVTASSSVEYASSSFQVARTRVGSPYVIEGIVQAKNLGARTVVGFEANGGFLLGSDILIGSRKISALLTRDAMIPIISTLATAKELGLSIKALVASLNMGAAASDRIPNISSKQSSDLINQLQETEFRDAFLRAIGIVESVNTSDGVRINLGNKRIIHFRSSGNAPELRCYTEAESVEEARRLLKWGLSAAETVINGAGRLSRADRLA